MSDIQNLDNSFEFDMYYEGKMVLCHISIGESDYGVHFDDELMDVIEMNEDGFWEGQGGVLDEEVVEEIGKRINDKFE